jgi:hypothetical protein
MSSTLPLFSYGIIHRPGGQGDPRWAHYSLEPGRLPAHVLDLCRVQFAHEEGLCRGCELSYRAHPIEDGTGRKFCTALLHDALRPAWRIEDLV